MMIIKSVLSKITGNFLMQRVLEKNVQISQYLMGMGSGSDVQSSGEKAIFDILERKCQPPYCVFDVGANKGQFLNLVLMDLKDREFTVHCFEPGKKTFKYLIESTDTNERIHLNNVGLGKEEGEAVLHYDHAGSGLASLTKRKMDHHKIDYSKSEKVKISTIDRYCKDHSISHIHLLKIDVEGHELDVLSGAKEMFAKNFIDIVTFEFGGCNIDTRTFFQDFWYFFREVNFSIFRITPTGYLQPLESYREEYEQFRTTNFLAVANR